MKKLPLITAFTTIFMGISSAYAADPDPDPSPAPGIIDQGSGKIDFIGSVIDAPCSVDSNDGKPVDLGSTSIQSLKDGKTNPKSFFVNLKNCNIGDPTKSKTVYITFTGSGAYAPGATNPNILGVTGSVKNIGIVLQNGTSEQITLGKTYAVRQIQNGNQDLPFAAYLTKVGASDPVPGQFTSTANFTLTYL